MQSVNQLQSMSTVQEFRSQQQFNYTQPVANQMTSNSRIYNNVELRQPVPMPAQVASNGYASPLQYEPNFNSRYVVNQTIPANQYVYNRPPVYNQYSNFSPSQYIISYVGWWCRVPSNRAHKLEATILFITVLRRCQSWAPRSTYQGHSLCSLNPFTMCSTRGEWRQFDNFQLLYNSDSDCWYNK